MSQQFIDWEMIESRKFDTYQYSILRVMDKDGRRMFRGWVYATNGSTWLENEIIDNLRSAMIEYGRQNS